MNLEPVIGADGVERLQIRRPHERKIETVFGTVEESRAGYGHEGVNSLHPLDAELNIPPERYSLEMRRRVAEEAAKNSFDETMEMIEKTMYSAGESDTRYTLNGLLFHTKPQENALLIVGTDGHRLALLKKKIDSVMKEEKQIIVPRKAVSELRRFLPATKKSDETEAPNVTIFIGDKHMLFIVNGVQFLTRLIEGTYPNYENVIPLDNKKKMIIERDNFSRVLRRVSVMSRERASAVRCDLGQDTLIVSSSNPDLGEAKEEIAIDYKDEKLSLGFNARYIIDALGAMISERVTFELQDPLSPVLMKEEGNEDYKCVIMPMRI